MPDFDAKVRETIKEASEATRWRCLNDEGELDSDLWLELADDMLAEEYLEHEEDLREEGRLYYIYDVQNRMRAASRRRVHRYMEETVDEEGNKLPALPTYESLKGEMVSVPKPNGGSKPKLVLMCTASEISAVVAMFGRISAQNIARRERYERILEHMRARNFGEEKRVKDLYH